MCGEFVGTVLFLWFALSGAQVANSVPSSAGLTVAETGSNPQQLQYIALSFGFSLAVNAWVFFRISGGLFNPAVTFGMCLIGALPWVRGVLLFVSQILGGMVASALVQCMFPGGLNVQTSLGGGTSVVQGLFIEMFLTAQLVFTIFMLAAEKHKGTFIAPVGELVETLLRILFPMTYIFLRRNRPLPLRRRANRRLLHRRQPQPSALLRARSREPDVPPLPLDLLAGSRAGQRRRSGFLQIHQNPRIRDGQPGPRHGPRGESAKEEEPAHRGGYQ
jgi:glycerol uptake facilitator-like aquaporin